MHWRFDPLFSIGVYHSKYKNADPDTGELPRKAPDFELQPTQGTAARLARLGWVFKTQTGSCTVYGEKVFSDDGTSALRSKPANGEGLTFFLRLKNPDLLNETKPFEPELNPDGTSIPLPSFSGRNRMLYFDNLDPNPRPDGVIWLTAAPVSKTQLGSMAPTLFAFTSKIAANTGITLTMLAPGPNAPQAFSLDPNTHSVGLEMPESGYKLTQVPGNQSEILFLTPEIRAPDALGIVRIFEPGGTGWEPHKRYQIIFEKA
jgi:hypothetical protein